MTRGTVFQDMFYAFQMMRRHPGFAAVAVLALAVGIGGNAAIFTVINAVLINALPYNNPEQMVVLARVLPGGPSRGVSIPKFLAWKDSCADVLTDMAVYDSGGPGVNLSRRGEPEQVKAIRVSREFFSLFRATPALGRFFTATEDQPGGPRVAVISHSLWSRRFGRSPEIASETVALNGEPHTVVGVVTADFEANPPADVWVPLQADPGSTNQAHFLLGAARLKPGVTIQAANARMTMAAEEFRRGSPNAMAPNETARVISMHDIMTNDMRPMLVVIWGAVILVQLIACANVANLQLLRAIGRAREIAIRVSLGATRTRLFGQLVTESIFLALVGCIAGLMTGLWVLTILLAFAPAEIPRLAQLTLMHEFEPSVLTFTLIISLLSGLLFGVVPALHVSRSDLGSGLREGNGRTGLGVLHRRLQAAIVVSELALGLMLLLGAGLLIRSARMLNRVEPGFKTENVLTFKTALNSDNYSTTDAVTQYRRKMVERLEHLPGVYAAASVTFLPTEGGPELSFSIEGRPATAQDGTGSAKWRLVSPSVFEVLSIPLLRGRVLNDFDSATSVRVAVINRTMARKYWPSENPLGKRVTIGGRLGSSLRDLPREIIGIVGDTREDGLQVEPPAVIYLPQTQVPDAFTKLTNSLVTTAWVISINGRSPNLMADIRREVATTDPQVAGFDFLPMDQVIQKSSASRRFVLVVLSVFAAVGLFLAAIGVYGLFSHSVQQRTQEIAVRLALGSNRMQVMFLLLRQSLVLAVMGVAIGLGAAAVLGRMLITLLFGVKLTDAPTLIGASLVLMIVATLATWIPARRGTRVDPATALRFY